MFSLISDGNIPFDRAQEFRSTWSPARSAALRDTLLPKLISGELRVKDAETFLDRVL